MSKRNEHVNEIFQPFLNSLLPEVEKDEVKCPECNSKLKFESGFDTDWHGNLKYYYCKSCKERFVSQDNKELEIAAE